jgi:hypothetical protein
MSTRFSTKRKYGDKSIDLGYDGSAVPDDLIIPSCGLEDIDRAMFNLFDKDLPLIYRMKDGSTRKVPVIFATGERFAITRRKEPIRDKNGAIVVPLITISRKSIEQQSQKGIEMGDIGTIDIKRQLSKDDPLYQRIVNSVNLDSTDVSSRREGLDRPGRMANGRLLEPNLGAGLYETISIPVPKFLTATYEITLWTQFMQHSNEILTTIMSGYHNIRARSYRIETNNGYWFNAAFETAIQTEDTFDDMSDSERTVKNTLTAIVPAYIILPNAPGIPNGVRRTISATQFSFGLVDAPLPVETRGNMLDMRLDSHLLNSIATVDDPTPVGSMATPQASQSTREAGGNQKMDASVVAGSTTSVGGVESGFLLSRTTTQSLSVDPITGHPMDVTVKVRRVSQAHGEEVLTVVNKTLKSDRDLK